jgi:outer membrane protein TolC
MKTAFPFLSSILISCAALAAPPPRAKSQTSTAHDAAQELNLGDVTRAVLAQNRSIREARAKWEAMKQRVPQAAAWDDLKISTTTTVSRFVDVSRNSFTDHMLTVEQMIPVSGKNRSRARIAAAEALGGLEELRRKELDIVMKARSAFIRLVNTRALLQLNHATEASLAQTVTISRARFEVGGQNQAEVLTAESERIRIGEARRDLERTIAEQESLLKVLMNRDPFSPLGEVNANLPDHVELQPERLRSTLLNDRPEVRMATAQVAAARAKLELARREWVPDPSLSVSAQRYNDASQAVSEVTAGISFNVPWLNGRKYRAEERESEATADAAQRSLEAARIEALGMLRDQLAKIETAHHHVMLFEEQLLPTLRQTVEANRAGYENNKTAFLDLISSQRSLLETESMHRQHLADYQTALAELEALVGADLHLFANRSHALSQKSK